MRAPRRHAPRALEGRDGWLFLDGDSNRVVAQHTGRRRLSRGEFKRWRTTLEQRAERAAARDLRLFTFVAPDKETVYPEHLPYAASADRPVLRLRDHLEEHASAAARIALLEDALIAAKASGPVYPATDTHWSPWGAHVALRAMGQDMGLDVIPDTSVDWVEEGFVGDLGAKCDPARSSRTRVGRVRAPRSVRTFDNDVINRGTIRVFERSDGIGPRGVIFGDSFCYPLLPLLAESFSHLVFAHSMTVDWELVDELGPEVIICLAVERFCIRPPDDDASVSVRAVAAEKLGRLRQ